MVKKTSILENEQNEFKEVFDQDTKKSIKKTIKAFLNTYGGTIYIGIKDDQTIVGVKEQDYDEISKWVGDVFSSFGSLIKVEFDSNKVVKILVDYDTNIIFEKNNYSAFVRVQATTRNFSGEELNKHILERKDKFENWKIKLDFFSKEGSAKLIYGNEKISKKSNNNIDSFIDNFSLLISSMKYYCFVNEKNQPFLIQFREKIIWNGQQFEIYIDIFFQIPLSNMALLLKLPINPGIKKITKLYFTTYKVIFDKWFNFIEIKNNEQLGLKSDFYSKAMENLNEIGIPNENLDDFKKQFLKHFYSLEENVRSNSSKIIEMIKKIILKF